jgi:hypothetical protein
MSLFRRSFLLSSVLCSTMLCGAVALCVGIGVWSAGRQTPASTPTNAALAQSVVPTEAPFTRPLYRINATIDYELLTLRVQPTSPFQSQRAMP